MSWNDFDKNDLLMFDIVINKHWKSSYCIGLEECFDKTDSFKVDEIAEIVYQIIMSSA